MGTYVNKNGQQEGPFEDAEILGRLSEGFLSGTDLGWRDGMAEWIPLHTLYPEHAHKLHLKEMAPTPPHIAPEDPKDPGSKLQLFILEQVKAGKHMPAVISKLLEMGVEEDLARTLVLKVFSENK